MIHQTPTDTTEEIEELFEGENQDSLAEIKKRSVSGAVSYLLRTLILNGISLATGIILGAYFSPKDYGIYGYVTQFVGLFVFFSDVGLAAALVQKKTEPTQVDYRTAFTVQQILSWCIFGGFIILSLTGIVQQTTGAVGTWLLLALGISFPLASLKTIPSIQLERKLDFNKLVIPQIFEQLVYNGILVFLAFNHWGVQAYTYAIIGRSLIGVLVIYFIQPWLPGFALQKAALKSLLGFGAKFQLNDLLARVKDQLFYIALAKFFSIDDFGYLQWAKTWSMQPYNLTVQNVMAITFPTFSRLQKNKQALAKAIDKSIFFISLAIFPILVGMSIFVIPFVHLVTKYQKWQPAIISLIFFTLSIAWSAISTPLTNTLNAIGEINTTLKLMVVWTVLTWVVTPITIYFFHLNGVALGALLISFTSVMPIYYVKKVVDIQVWSNVWRQLLAAFVMAGVGVVFLPTWSQSIPAMMVGMVVASFAYGTTLLVCGKDKLLQEFRSLKSK
jgi:O-antigen/teichoic acid export membrane protein